MEAVPAASGVRRTVRLAGALVAGQILLVVVIGWVTFTCADDQHAPSAPAVNQLAAPPALIPPPSAPGATSAPSSAAGSPQKSRSRTQGTAPTATDSPADPTVAPPAPPSTSQPAFGTVTVPSAPPTTGSAPTATPVLAQSSAAPTPSSSPPVAPVAGQPCPRMFAFARDADGRLLACLPTRDHQLRWKIV